MITEKIKNSYKDTDRQHYKMTNNIEINLENLQKIQIKDQLEKQLTSKSPQE